MITVSKALLGETDCPGTCREFQWGDEEDTSEWQRQELLRRMYWQTYGYHEH